MSDSSHLQPQPPDASVFAATIGMDWADTQHAVCIRHSDGCVQHLTLVHRPAELAAWLAGLRARYAPRRVAIALEQGRTALLYALLEHQDFITLFPVPPQAIHAYRKAVLTTSGAKSDPADAALIEDYLHHHRAALRPWSRQDDTTRLLRGLTERRRLLVDDRTRLTNALQADLKLAYPVVIEVFEHLGTVSALDFLKRWPDMSALKKATRQTLRKFFIAHHWRNTRSLDEKLDLLLNARALITDATTLQIATASIAASAAQLRVLIPVIESYETQIDTAYATHPCAAIFDTLPGAGRALAPRLAALFGTEKERWPDAKSIQVFSGIAPSRQQSGKSEIISKRWACPKFLRQTVHEFARMSTRSCAWAKAHVESQMKKGKAYHTAIRSLAFKWLRILWRMWHDSKPYCEATFTSAQANSQKCA